MDMVAILEDDRDREVEMLRVLPEHQIYLDRPFFRTAHTIIEWLEAGAFESLAALCLDHDLVPVDGTDPGDGLDVARWLAEQPIRVPVLIHSSNSERAQRMEWVLQDAGFNAYWTPPSAGVEWIDRTWIQALLKLIGRS